MDGKKIFNIHNQNVNKKEIMKRRNKTLDRWQVLLMEWNLILFYFKSFNYSHKNV